MKDVLIAQLLPFAGNINFNAHHSPTGAFMSFTCGRFDSGGGIGVEIGKAADQNLFIGVKNGTRRASGPIRCLPFFKGSAAAAAQTAAASYQVEGSKPSAPAELQPYDAAQVRRYYGWATDAWETADFKFSIYTPFGAVPAPNADSQEQKASLLPAVLATLEVDNRHGKDVKTALFAIDFVEQGAHILSDEQAGGQKLGFAWRRNLGVLGKLESDAGQAPGELFALQRWSVAEGLTDVNPIHALGNSAGLAMEVPAGTKCTLILAIGVYLGGVVTTGLEGRYYYTRFYTSLQDVLSAALDRSVELRQSAARLDGQLIASALSADQQFLIAHGTRGYYGNTQLLDIAGDPLWVVNEGEYCMMNTLDLAVDQAFWELKHNPWVVANILTNFVRRYSYHDQVKTRSGQLLPGGISFCHDMGVNNNFSSPGNSSYELAHLKGCFSYMTQEQLCNWVLTAACYVAATRDTEWLLANKHLFDACAQSMRARANPRTGLMIHDSARCVEGQEITTYDSLDESLGQARASTYLATKCWATWIGLDMLSRLRVAAGDRSAELKDNPADNLAELLINSAVEGTIPAVLEKENPGYRSRSLPVIESLIYPAYWLNWLKQWPAAETGDAMEMLADCLKGPFIDSLRQHALRLLTDPHSGNLTADGGIKLSSTSNNTWISKIAIVQHVARRTLRLEETDPRIADIQRVADAAHVRWQTDGTGSWACSDQFIKGEAKGSRYYPRIITAALWLDGLRKPRASEESARAKPLAVVDTPK